MISLGTWLPALWSGHVLRQFFCKDDLRKMPTPLNAGSAIQRTVLIAMLIALVAVIGHWGVRSLRLRSGMGRTSSVVAARSGKLFWGEKEGADADDIPRPPNSRRIGVIAAPGANRNLSLHYLTFTAMEDVAQFYREQMPALGWRAHPAPESRAEDYAGTVLFYSNRAGNSCIITISETPGGTGVTIMKQGREEPR